MEKVTLRFVFGIAQILMSLIAVGMALDLKFNVFNVQIMFNISRDAVNYYVVLLLAFGLIFIIGGLFLVFDWWELRR